MATGSRRLGWLFPCANRQLVAALVVHREAAIRHFLALANGKDKDDRPSAS